MLGKSGVHNSKTGYSPITRFVKNKSCEHIIDQWNDHASSAYETDTTIDYLGKDLCNHLSTTIR